MTPHTRRDPACGVRGVAGASQRGARILTLIWSSLARAVLVRVSGYDGGTITCMPSI
jgi:hypothetical protein